MAREKEEKKCIIWSNMDINPDDFDFSYLDDEEREALTDEDKYQLACEYNDRWLDDERENLNIELSHPIIAIAELGLWNGSRQAFKVVGTNIRDILSSECDFIEWYADRHDIRATGIHHDGRNTYLYRELHKISFAGLQKKVNQAAIDGETVDLMKYTRSIRPHVADFYGWTGKKKVKRVSKQEKINQWVNTAEECWF